MFMLFEFMFPIIFVIVFGMIIFQFVTGIGTSKRNPSVVKMDYGTSAVYSKKDMDAAIKIIMKEFEAIEGCELHSLSYASDEECNTAENIAWMNQCKAKDDPEVFTQCIAFDSSFHSPKTDSGAWNPDEEYTDW